MKSVILTGFMGAGKTTVGKLLARLLDIPFLDTDDRIEEKAEMKISRIFEEKGEEGFRAMETKMLRELLGQKTAYVISCGGGLPLRSENAELLKQLGTVFYLTVTAETVKERLKGDTTRPLLMGSNAEEKIELLLNSRRARYEAAADYCVAADGKTPEAVCNEIMSLLQQM